MAKRKSTRDTPTTAPAKSKPEELLYNDLIAAGYPAKQNYTFCPERNWSFDLAFPEVPGRPGFKLGIEIHGRAPGGGMGRHQRAAGEKEDMQKENCAIECYGYYVLKYPAGSVGINKRRKLIVEQIGRAICNTPCVDSAGTVLVGD